MTKRKTTIRVFSLADHMGHRRDGVHGGTTYILNTFPALRAAGIELTAVFMGARHRAGAELEAAGIPVHFLELRKWSLRSFTAFLPLLDRAPHQLLHLSAVKSHIAGQMAAARRGLPALVHVHDQTPLPRFVRPAARYLGRTTSALVGVSGPVTRFAMRDYGVRPARCHTIENGLHFSAFDAARAAPASIREELGLGMERRLIAVVGRVHAIKGQRELIGAMPGVVRRAPELCLLVVGDGPAMEECRRLVQDLDLSEHVKLLGQRADVPAILAQVEFTVMPTLVEEGLPFSVLESLAAGLPVVAADAGGIGTLLAGEDCGLLVAKGDMEGFRDAIVRLFEDPDLCARLGHRGREKAEQFSIGRHVERLVGLYEALLSERAQTQAAAPVEPCTGRDR